eukprot:2538853-Rhodomonas_salina.6
MQGRMQEASKARGTAEVEEVPCPLLSYACPTRSPWAHPTHPLRELRGLTSETLLPGVSQDASGRVEGGQGPGV